MTDKEIWYAAGMHIPTSHPPSDTGTPEEWPVLFEAFQKALEIVRCEATDNALTVMRHILGDDPPND